MSGFHEFFAGGGMARMGLGASWNCLFANDFDARKSRAYEKNWGTGILKTCDIADLKTSDLPGQADAAWASFPCQDLSLAGNGAGLAGKRSGAFWVFRELMRTLVRESRPPKLIVLENVHGALTARGGRDFAAICAALDGEGYRCGAVVIDAALFVPQSRPRLFVIGVRDGLTVPAGLTARAPCAQWHDRALRAACDRLPPSARERWIWWNLPRPARRNTRFADLIEDDPADVAWRDERETGRLLAMMNGVNRAKVAAASGMPRRTIGAVYKRTRRDANGARTQRAEVRFDDVAGCLRTPAGGSSRQLVLAVDGPVVRSRLVSGREAARLMGLPDDYELPSNYNEAYRLAGDGVVVPVVRHVAAHILEPVLSANGRAARTGGRGFRAASAPKNPAPTEP